jgi:hypothetical protein
MVATEHFKGISPMQYRGQVLQINGNGHGIFALTLLRMWFQAAYRLHDKPSKSCEVLVARERQACEMLPTLSICCVQL